MSHAAQIASVAQHAAQRFSHVGEPPLTFFLRRGRRFGHFLVMQGTVRSVFCGVGVPLDAFSATRWPFPLRKFANARINNDWVD